MQEKPGLEETLELMKDLRQRCDWDAAQTHESLRPYLIEEAYEVVDAIDRDDRDALREEIGDFLLEAVFLAEITRAEGSFDIYDSITAIYDKLVRRHPHVFGDAEAKDAEEVLVNWEKLKSDDGRGYELVTKSLALTYFRTQCFISTKAVPEVVVVRSFEDELTTLASKMYQSIVSTTWLERSQALSTSILY